jgi:hypothetical protein
MGLDLALLQPPLNRFGDEFRPVVAAQVFRHAPLCEDPLQYLDHGIRRQPALDFDRQALAREFVYEGQELERPAVRRRVKDEIVGPDVVRTRCLLRHGARMLTAVALPTDRAL